MTLSKERLTRLVKQRERLERIEERALSQALSTRTARVLAIEATKDRRSRSLDQKQFTGPSLDLGARINAWRHVEWTDRQLAAQGAALEHSDHEVGEAREQLLARRRDRRSLEALLDRAEREQKRRRERTEALQLDEAATNGWFRNNRSRKGRD